MSRFILINILGLQKQSSCLLLSGDSPCCHFLDSLQFAQIHAPSVATIHELTRGCVLSCSYSEPLKFSFLLDEFITRTPEHNFSAIVIHFCVVPGPIDVLISNISILLLSIDKFLLRHVKQLAVVTHDDICLNYFLPSNTDPLDAVLTTLGDLQQCQK